MRPAALLFLLTGLVSATWAARVPAVQEGLGLSPTALAVAILGLEGGAIAGLPAGGALVLRRGSRAVLRLGFATYPLGLVAIALAPSLAALAAALALMAFANSLVDVALNVSGVALERRAGRPLMSRLHAGHAFGVLAGGLAGTAAAGVGAGVALHFAVVAGVALVAGELAACALADDEAAARRATRAAARRATRAAARRASGAALGGPEPSAPSRPATITGAAPDSDVRRRRSRVSAWLAARVDRRLALLGAVAFCAFLLDGGAHAWIAVQLRAGGAEPALAAAGFTAFALALAVGRLGADRLVDRHGRAAVVRAGGALAAAGIGVALLVPVPGLALAGWAALGAGLAPIAPGVLAAAGGASRLPAPAAIATVTSIGYLGSFTGPPLIGALAAPFGLTAALGLMAVAALTAALLARPALAR